MGETSRVFRGLRTVLVSACVTIGVSLVGATVSLSQGCVDRRCEAGPAIFVDGRAVDETRFESGPVDGSWLNFSHQRTIVVRLPKGMAATVFSVVVYVSPTESPAKDGFALATGNLAVVSVQDPETIYVRNDTCADYYTRIVIETERTLKTADADARADADVAADADAGLVVPPDANDADGNLDRNLDGSANGLIDINPWHDDSMRQDQEP